MSKNHPETLATKSLKALGLPFEGHVYEYEEHGGTRVSAQKLGVDEFAVLKTLVMQNENREPMLVLMHGTQSVSTKALARAAQCKTIEPAHPRWHRSTVGIWWAEPRHLALKRKCRCI
jgi:prolyl-tRNA editing enzyme YbaK/EbsC (Cys-tRNA(Pro) deacylase)